MARPVPVHKNWVKIVQAYFDGIQRILLGDQTAQKAMDQVNEEIQALLTVGLVSLRRERRHPRAERDR